MRQAWTYEVSQRRVRHRRGYYHEQYELIRNDGKVVAQNEDRAVINRIRARFESWARQPWSTF